jgi:predicted secreted Zn-dependent protease
MKKIFLFMLLISMVSACAQLPTHSSSTENPAPTSTFTFTPTSTPQPTFTLTPTLTFTPIPTEANYANIFINNAKITYYDITGTTESELRNSIDSKRPKDPFDGNRPVDSYTDWYFSWNWQGYGTDTCDLSTAVVAYKIKVKVPRWETPSDVSPELIAKWEEYMQKLALHEQGHVDNIVNNYLDVKTAIQGATCTTAEAAAQAMLVQLRKFDSSYDLETKHGATQGAIFP